jgi:hypothetical protein
MSVLIMAEEDKLGMLGYMWFFIILKAKEISTKKLRWANDQDFKLYFTRFLRDWFYKTLKFGLE